MIEVVSSPAELATWDPDKQPFYLEVYAGTRQQPVLGSN
jgi:hypothetical protein